MCLAHGINLYAGASTAHTLSPLLAALTATLKIDSLEATAAIAGSRDALRSVLPVLQEMAAASTSTSDMKKQYTRAITALAKAVSL